MHCKSWESYICILVFQCEKKKKKYKRKKKVEGGIKGGKNKSKAKKILAELARKEHGSPVQCVGLVMFVRWQEGKVNVRWAWSKE